MSAEWRDYFDRLPKSTVTFAAICPIPCLRASFARISKMRVRTEATRSSRLPGHGIRAQTGPCRAVDLCLSPTGHQKAQLDPIGPATRPRLPDLIWSSMNFEATLNTVFQVGSVYSSVKARRHALAEIRAATCSAPTAARSARSSCTSSIPTSATGS